jgi:TnpA family transposase
VTPDARVLRFAARGRHAGGPPADYGRFPEELSLDELASSFFFDDEDRRLIARRRTDTTRLGFAVQLGTLRYLGRFLEDPAEVPAGVVQWSAREIGVSAGTDLAAYARGEWRWAHQDEIRREYGYRPFGHAGVEDDLVGWLRARAWVSAESHPVLFARAVEYLIGAKVLLPGASTLWRLVGAAREHANERGWTLLGGALTDEQGARLEGLLAVVGGRRESELERLRRAPVEPTVAGLIATLERLRELRAVADGLGGLDSLPVARMRALTVDAATRRAGDLAKMSDARRLATLVAFATVAAQRGQDDALEHFDRLHGELQLRVRKQGERERLRDGQEIDRAGLTLVDACRALLTAAPHEPVADAIFRRVDRAGLADAVAAMERLARSPEERARDLILTRYGAVRRYLPLLLDTLDFHATDAGEPILDALDALQRTARQRRLTPQELPTELVPRHWRPLVEPEPGRIDRAAYTMCALEALRDGLRRRDVYVARSERYGDPRASLLDAPTWNASRSDVCRSLSLPETPEPFLERLGADLDAAYRRTLERLHPEHPIHELAAGRLPVEQLDALPEPPSLLALRDQVDRRLPDADLPDLLLEIAAKTGFIDGFAHEHERRAHLSDLPTSICAVLVAQACNVGYAPLVDETIPALREARLKYVARHYIRPETLIAANARIVDYHAALELATRWGGGEVASIDGLRFVVPNRTIHAGFNRRYYHRRRGVTALTTTADHHATLHTVVVPGTQPDALYLLDGLLDPQTSVRPREVMTDTAGYTDVVFGLFLLLGYQFSPRLADAGGARFWRLDPIADYGPLNQLARHRLTPTLIAEHYDDLLRVAGSLLQRHTTGSQLMRALRSHTRHLSTLARAIAQVGRAAKTIHLLDYCNDETLRRRILAQLNRGETRHALAREVFHGRRGELRQPYRQGQEEQLTALGLVVNCIALYNTIYTQRALDQLTTLEHPIRDEDIERLSPLGHEHITLTGRYRIALPDPLHDRAAYRPLKTPPPDAAAA